MGERHRVETTYRGQRLVGKWYLEGGQLHVATAFGRRSGALSMGGAMVSLPSELAAQLLWQIAREADSGRPFFYWPPERLPSQPSVRFRPPSKVSSRSNRLAIIVLVIVATFAAATLLQRSLEGRCRDGGYKGGVDCTYRAAEDS